MQIRYRQVADWIYCGHFVNIDGNFLQGPLVLEMEKESLDQVNKYDVRK